MEQQQKWLIETRGLTKVYGDGEEIRALNEVDLQVSPGEFVAIMGPSGSGKSTLLNLIGALDRPTQGDIYVDSQDMSKIHDLDSFRSKTVGFVF
jgi:ABC-type lipoprotein export system ATPase subunit